MVHIIRHGKGVPSKTDLKSFQLGWDSTNKNLYINDTVNDSIEQVNAESDDFSNSRYEFFENLSINFEYTIKFTGNSSITISWDSFTNSFSIPEEYFDGYLGYPRFFQKIEGGDFSTTCSMSSKFGSDQGFLKYFSIITVADQNMSNYLLLVSLDAFKINGELKGLVSLEVIPENV